MARRISASVSLLLLLSAVLADSATLERMSLEQLTAAAHGVVQAQCLGNQSRWEGGEIWTFTSFEVSDTMKGVVPRLITVRTLGGQVGHVISLVEGVPRFHPGEEVVLFIERTHAGDFSITSWAQGTFRVRRDAHTGRETATQDISGQPSSDLGARRFRSDAVRNISLELFKQRVRRALEREQNGARQ